MYQIDFNRPGKVHFIGIGGISMSGLAEILLTEGFAVSGSDQNRSELTDHLAALGAEVHIGHRAENIRPDMGLVVYTAAIHPDNPEYQKTLELGIPLMSRADLLGQIMTHYGEAICISGTHGKTTTTGMVSTILMECGADPTISIGGVLPGMSGSGNIRVGGREHFVCESCEYTNSFLSFFPTTAVILNVAEDHLDFFKDIDDIRHSFRRFAELVPANGLLAVNRDIDDFEYFTKDLPCRTVTYSADDPAADYTAQDIIYDEACCGSYVLVKHGERLGSVKLSVPGAHNVSNSLAAMAVSLELGLSFGQAARGLEAFTGTKRRFERKGTVHGVEIIDDYAHHPDEIAATLKIANGMKKGKLWLAFQSHTYTRTAALFDEFVEALSAADEVVLAPIYAAREKNTIGISAASLAEALRGKGTDAVYFESFGEIEDYLLTHAEPGDLVLTMGAGDIYKVGEALL